MKVFTVQDYFSLSEENQTKVTTWLNNYELEDVIMVTSQSSMTQDLGTKNEFEEDHVAVYADISVKRYISPSEYIRIANSDISPNAYTKIAELFFDDFPVWPD